VPLRDIVSRPATRNWTQYAVGEMEIASADDQADYLCWLRDDGEDAAWLWYDTYKLPDNYLDYIPENSSNLGTLANGDYYFEDLEAYVTKGARVIFRFTEMGCGPSDEGKTRFDADAAALWDGHRRWEAMVGTASLGTDYVYDKVPHMRIEPTVSYLTDPGGPDEAEVQMSGTTPDRVTLYRGMYPNVDSDVYPVACGIPWDNLGNNIGDVSLRWFGEDGMYAQWWQAWHQMLLNGKPATQQFALPLTELMGFSFKEKIRLLSMDYMIKRLRIARVLGRGMVLVEADMISTI